MIQNLRKHLKKISFLHNFYMKLKRKYTGEILGMTTKSEQDYFAFYGENLYKGAGEIADLGCWMGSTTIPLVSGLLKNPAFVGSGRKVFAYDIFIWNNVMKESVAGTDLVGKYKDGDSFLDEFKRRTANISEHLEIRAGDLKKIGWNDGKIEFLLVDAMKNWELTNSILKNFYRQLIEGESLVLQQDFAHYFTPWIHLIHWNLRDYFAFETDVSNSSSVVFRNVKRIPAELLEKNYGYESFSDAELDQAIDYSLSLVAEEKKANILACKVMNYIHQQRLDDARRIFEKIAAENLLEKDLLTVQNLLESHEN